MSDPKMEPIDIIMDEISRIGSWLEYPYSEEMANARQELVDAGLIESLEDAGIKFINESYFYIEKGNPRNVHVEKEHNSYYISL